MPVLLWPVLDPNALPPKPDVWVVDPKALPELVVLFAPNPPKLGLLLEKKLDMTGETGKRFGAKIRLNRQMAGTRERN